MAQYHSVALVNIAVSRQFARRRRYIAAVTNFLINRDQSALKDKTQHSIVAENILFAHSVFEDHYPKLY